MLSTFRKFQKEMLILVTVFIIVAFAFFTDFGRTDLGSMDCVLTVDDRCYRVEEAQKLARYQDLAFNLGLTQFAQALRYPDRLGADPTRFVLNMLVLRHEAERLGIEPTADEIKNAMPDLPIFAQPWVNADSIRNLLGSLALTEEDLTLLVKDYLRYNKMRDLLGAGIQEIPTDLEKTYIQENQRYTAHLINFERKDFEEKVELTEEEIKKYYDDRNGEEPEPEPEEPVDMAEDPNVGAPEPEPAAPALQPLLTDPARGFDYIKFVPEEHPEDATAEVKDKADVVFRKGINRIYSDLAEDGADFVAIAKAAAAQEHPFKIEVGKFEPFKQDSPPEALKDDPRIVAAIFSATLAKDGVSPPVAGSGGSYYIFKFSELIEPRKMTFEEAKPLIEKALIAKKSNTLTSDAANEAVNKLSEALKAGKSILDAASANNYDLVSLPKFSELEPPADRPDAGLIVESVQGLSQGDLSAVKERPGGQGYFFTYVDKIELYKDDKKDAALREIAAAAEHTEKSNLFVGWLRNRGKAIGAQWMVKSIMDYPSR